MEFIVSDVAKKGERVRRDRGLEKYMEWFDLKVESLRGKGYS